MEVVEEGTQKILASLPVDHLSEQVRKGSKVELRTDVGQEEGKLIIGLGFEMIKPGKKKETGSVSK